VVEESADGQMGRGNESDQPAWGRWLVVTILTMRGRIVTI